MADAKSLTLGALLRESRVALTAASVDNPGLDARLLVEFFTDTTPLEAVTEAHRSISPDLIAVVRAAVARRIAGEPVHRILGFRAFYGMDLRLSASTLEPRPDTETLVDAILPTVRKIVDRAGSCRVLDLGTGTGGIALALLANVPEAIATGVDVSGEALATARENAAIHGLSARFSTVESDWLETVEGRWDVIVSNPPYIMSASIAKLAPEVREHDPLLALDGGVDGLDAYRRIACAAQDFVEDEGLIGVEIGFDQRRTVAGLFLAEGFVLEDTFLDLAGHDRALTFKKSRELRKS